MKPDDLHDLRTFLHNRHKKRAHELGLTWEEYELEYSVTPQEAYWRGRCTLFLNEAQMTLGQDGYQRFLAYFVAKHVKSRK